MHGGKVEGHKGQGFGVVEVGERERKKWGGSWREQHGGRELKLSSINRKKPQSYDINVIDTNPYFQYVCVCVYKNDIRYNDPHHFVIL